MRWNKTAGARQENMLEKQLVVELLQHGRAELPTLKKPHCFERSWSVTALFFSGYVCARLCVRLSTHTNATPPAASVPARLLAACCCVSPHAELSDRTSRRLNWEINKKMEKKNKVSPAPSPSPTLQSSFLRPGQRGTPSPLPLQTHHFGIRT